MQQHQQQNLINNKPQKQQQLAQTQAQQGAITAISSGDKFDSLKACAKRLFVQKHKDLTDITTQSTQVKELETTAHEATALLSKATQRVASLTAELESMQGATEIQCELSTDVELVCTMLSTTADKIHSTRGMSNAVNGAAAGTLGEVGSAGGLEEAVRRTETISEDSHNSCPPLLKLSGLALDVGQMLNHLQMRNAAAAASEDSARSNSGEGDGDNDDVAAAQMHRYLNLLQADHHHRRLPTLAPMIYTLQSRGPSTRELQQLPAGVAQCLDRLKQLKEMVVDVKDRESMSPGSSPQHPPPQFLPTFTMAPTAAQLDVAAQYAQWVSRCAVEGGIEVSGLVGDIGEDVMLGGASGSISSKCSSISSSDAKVQALCEQAGQLLLHQQAVGGTMEETTNGLQMQEEKHAQIQQQLRAHAAVTEVKQKDLVCVQTREEALLARLQELETLNSSEETAEANCLAATQRVRDINEKHEITISGNEAVTLELQEEQVALAHIMTQTSTLREEIEFAEQQHPAIGAEVHLGQSKVDLLNPALDTTKRMEENQEKEYAALASALKNLDTIEGSNLAAYLPLASAMAATTGAADPSPSSQKQSQSSTASKKKGGNKKKGATGSGKKVVTFSQEDTAGVMEAVSSQQQLTGLQVNTILDVARRHVADIKLCMELGGGGGNTSGASSATVWALLEELQQPEGGSDQQQQEGCSGGCVSFEDPSLRRLARDVELQLSCRSNEVASTVSKLEHHFADCVQRQDKLLVSNNM